jgi:hypothetical protein
MIVAFFILLGGVMVTWLEFRRAGRQIDRKEQIVFLLLLGIGIGLSVMKAIGVYIPNPMDYAIAFYQPFYELIIGFFGQNGS